MRTVRIFIVAAIMIVMGLALTTNNSTRLLQTTQRTAAVVKLCANYPSRDQLVSDQDKADGEVNNAAMKASFKLSGNQLLGTIVKSDDKMSAALEQVQPMYTELGFFIGPFVLGLLINLVIWMCLCCCCCCPSCCPSKCCQKPDAEPYTKCEMLWPSIVLILALLLIVIASIIGITRASAIQESYQAVGCSAAITFDDIVNGNKSSTGKFFVGLTPLKNGLNDLKTNKNSVKTQMDKLSFSTAGSDLRDAYDAGTTLLTDITKVPDGTANGAMAAFSYAKYFDGTGTPNTASTFPTALGQVPSSGTASGAVNVSHYAINKLNDDVLKKIGESADIFRDQFGSIDSIVDGAVDQIGGFVDQITGFDSMFTGMDDQISPIMKLVTMGVTAAFGVFIGLGVLSIVGTLMMTFCDKYKCRYLIYFVCTILTLLGIFCFLITILFSIMTPVIYFGCDYIKTSISSPAGFSANLDPLVGSDLTGMVGICLPGGTGDIVNKLGVDLTALDGLSDAVNSLRLFDASVMTAGVQTALDGLSDFINKYYYSDQYDFSEPLNQQFLAKVASPTNAAYAGCNFNSFTQDKWVPSLRNNAFSCGSFTPTATDTQCTTPNIQAGRNTPASNCYGCLDSTKIFVTHYIVAPNPPGTYGTEAAAAAQIATDLTARYNGVCSAWIADMQSVSENYYMVKGKKIGPVHTNMAAAKTTYNTATTGYKAQLDNLGTNVFPAVITAMQSIATLADPNYGVLSGLNCLIMGQDINLIANTTCAKLFNTFFTLRMTLGITAFGILFTMCCSTWSGVRHYKHSMRKGSILPGNEDSGLGAPQDSTMMALNQKKY